MLTKGLGVSEFALDALTHAFKGTTPSSKESAPESALGEVEE